MNERLKPEARIREETRRRLEHLPRTQTGVEKALILPAANQDNFYKRSLPLDGSPPKVTGLQPRRLRLQAGTLPPDGRMDDLGWLGQRSRCNQYHCRTPRALQTLTIQDSPGKTLLVARCFARPLFPSPRSGGGSADFSNECLRLPEFSFKLQTTEIVYQTLCNKEKT